jgi:hypothetical protein
MKSYDPLNNALDLIRDTDPLATLAQNLIDAGVTEEQLAEALKHRRGEPIAVALQNAYRDVAHGVPTVNKWGVVCKLRKKKE